MGGPFESSSLLIL